MKISVVLLHTTQFEGYFWVNLSPVPSKISAGLYAKLMFYFMRNHSTVFFQSDFTVYIPVAMYEDSSLSTLVIFCLIYYSHSCGYVVGSHYGFNLHLLND